MKILLRNSEKKRWQKLEPFGYDNETQLEALLEESPDLLPTENGKPVLFLKRQVSLGSNAVDLLGVDAGGNIVVVECKLEANREARRMVVGQILEYAAQLWGMAFEEFEGLLAAESEVSLAELVRQRVGDGDWSEENFHAGIQRRLEEGDFRLVIAVNGITEELKGILEYLNARGSVRLEALELRHFTDGNSEVLVPEIHGEPSHIGRSPGQRGQRRTLDEVYANAEDPDAGRRLKWFVEGWEAAGHEAIPGTSGISFRVNLQGRAESLFVALTPNIFAFHRGALRRRGIPDEAIENFLRTLGAFPCADAKKFATQSEPRLLVDRMSDDDARHLLEAALDLVKRWQEVAS